MIDYTKVDEVKSEEDQKDYTAFRIFFLLCYLCACSIILCVIDEIFFQNRFSANLLTKSDCEFVVPAEYTILSNGKNFIIQTDFLGTKEYLSGDPTDIRDMYIFIRKPTPLWSECKAKGYLKLYLKQIGKIPRKRNFKIDKYKTL